MSDIISDRAFSRTKCPVQCVNKFKTGITVTDWYKIQYCTPVSCPSAFLPDRQKFDLSRKNVDLQYYLLKLRTQCNENRLGPRCLRTYGPNLASSLRFVHSSAQSGRMTTEKETEIVSLKKPVVSFVFGNALLLETRDRKPSDFLKNKISVTFC